jgi:hypothetical protein
MIGKKALLTNSGHGVELFENEVGKKVTRDAVSGSQAAEECCVKKLLVVRWRDVEGARCNSVFSTSYPQANHRLALKWTHSSLFHARRTCNSTNSTLDAA